jgi:hypothetical protein
MNRDPLEEYGQSPSSEKIAEVVRGLGEERPSLEWESKLSDALSREYESVAKHKRFWGKLRWSAAGASLAAAAACAWGLFVITSGPEGNVPTSSLEMQVIEAHLVMEAAEENSSGAYLHSIFNSKGEKLP